MDLVSFAFNHDKAHLRAAVSMDDDNDNDGDGWQSEITNKYFHYYLLLNECSISQYRSRILTEYREISSATTNHKRRIFFSFTVWSNWSVLTLLCAPSRKRKNANAREERELRQRDRIGVCERQETQTRCTEVKKQQTKLEENDFVFCVCFSLRRWWVQRRNSRNERERGFKLNVVACVTSWLSHTNTHTHDNRLLFAARNCCMKRRNTQNFCNKRHSVFVCRHSSSECVLLSSTDCCQSPMNFFSSFPIQQHRAISLRFLDCWIVFCCRVRVLDTWVCCVRARDALFSMQRRRRSRRRRKRWNLCSPHSPDISHD